MLEDPLGQLEQMNAEFRRIGVDGSFLHVFPFHGFEEIMLFLRTVPDQAGAVVLGECLQRYLGERMPDADDRGV